MYASYPLSSSSSRFAAKAHLPDPNSPPGVELRCTDLSNGGVTSMSLSSDQFPESVRLALPPLLAQIYSAPLPTTDEFTRAATQIGALLERCCVVVAPELAEATEDFSQHVTLLESTAWKRRESLRGLIQHTRTACAKEIQADTILFRARNEETPLLEITSTSPLARASSLHDPAGRVRTPLPQTPTLQEGELRTDSPAQASSKDDSRNPHSHPDTPAAKKSQEMVYAQELYKLTLLANTRCPWRIYAVASSALLAGIANLASMILSTNVPLCSDSAFLNYMNHIRILDVCTASLATATVFFSLFSRFAFLPGGHLSVYRHPNPSRRELEPERLETIQATYSHNKECYPDCLLSAQAQQVRRNMQELAEQTQIEWELCEMLRQEKNLPPEQSSCIQKTLLEGGRVVSYANLGGMFLMALSAGAALTLRLTLDGAEPSCSTNTTSSSHDGGKDLIQYTVWPFIATALGCALLCLDAHRKHSQRQEYLARRIPGALSAADS